MEMLIRHLKPLPKYSGTPLNQPSRLFHCLETCVNGLKQVLCSWRANKSPSLQTPQLYLPLSGPTEFPPLQSSLLGLDKVRRTQKERMGEWVTGTPSSGFLWSQRQRWKKYPPPPHHLPKAGHLTPKDPSYIKVELFGASMVRGSTKRLI